MSLLSPEKLRPRRAPPGSWAGLPPGRIGPAFPLAVAGLSCLFGPELAPLLARGPFEPRPASKREKRKRFCHSQVFKIC